MATSKTSPAPAKANTTKAAAVAELRDIQANAKHDDPRQSIERLAKAIADAIEAPL